MDKLSVSIDLIEIDNRGEVSQILRNLKWYNF